MVVDDLSSAVIRQRRLPLSNKMVKELPNECLSSNSETHPHLMLKVDFQFPAESSPDMHFDLQASFNRRQSPSLALPPAATLMSELASDLTPLRAVMCMFTALAIPKRLHKLAAIHALIEHCIGILVEHDLVEFEDDGGQDPIMVENDLKIDDKGLVPSIQFELVSEEAALDKSLDGVFLFSLWELWECGRVESILLEGVIVSGCFHRQECNKLLIMSAKPFGCKLIDTHVSYKAFLTNNNPVFNQRMKRILNHNYQHIVDRRIFEKTSQPTPHLFYFYASQYDSHRREDIEDFIVQQIDHFLNNSNSSFAVVYVHSSIFDFIAFRKFIEKWPEHFFHRMRKVYIMGPSFIVKVVQTISVGTFYRLCDEIFQNVENELAIEHYDTQILKSIGETIGKTESFKNSVKVISNKLYGKNIDAYVSNSLSKDLSFGRYPEIIMELMRRILRDPEELRVQGIFRKSCDFEELQRLEEEIIGEEEGAIGREQDIFVVVGCLKKILHNLNNPLFNYAIYKKVINYKDGDELTFIRGLLVDMEYVNRKVFVLMSVFLNEYVIAQKDYNKMSSYNLAVIFGPCFFRPKEYDLKDLIYSGKFAKILVTLFDKQQELIEESEIALASGTLRELLGTTSH